MTPRSFTWLDIVRLGLVQTALGAIVVFASSALSRIMVVELLLPEVVPGVLLGIHHAVQVLRPRFGFETDVSGRSTRSIVGGMLILGIGGFLASVATAWMGTHLVAGMVLAVTAFFVIGIGVGASGTALLVLLAKRVAAPRRPAAATIVWTMMIAGFIVTSLITSRFLDPYSPDRLVLVAGFVSLAACCLAIAAIWGIEGNAAAVTADPAMPAHATVPFMQALREVWAERQARTFTLFVFASMIAYGAEDLILKPFAGLVFSLTPGQTMKLTAVQSSGVLTGMVAIGTLGTLFGERTLGTLRMWTIIGCIASAAALGGLAVGAMVGTSWPLHLNVFLLGLANGVYAVAAIGSMMTLAGHGRAARQGTRMGLWGAAQGVAFGLGGFIGAAAVNLARWWFGSTLTAYSAVFAFEGLVFLASAVLAWQVGTEVDTRTRLTGRRTGSTDIDELPPGLQPAHLHSSQPSVRKAR